MHPEHSETSIATLSSRVSVTKKDQDIFESQSESSTTINYENLCGCGPMKPVWLQKFNNEKCLVISLSLAAFMQGVTVNGEDRYNFFNC